MLEDPDATHSKSIENYFGNLDREVKKSGPQGFDKATSDLVIKYSKDLIGDDYQWCTPANRTAAKKVKTKQSDFNEIQMELIKSGVDDVDASNICTENKVIKCVSECKKSHNGPVDNVEELKMIASKLSSNEKSLHKALNLEIRFRKLTLTDVKATCPLFRQKGLTIYQKVQNLETLITSQLEFRALAGMEDLEAAINKGDQDLVNEANGNNIQNPEIDAKVHDTVVREDTVGVDAETLFKEEDFIIGLFVDGPYPGKIVKVNPETIVGNFMHPEWC